MPVQTHLNDLEHAGLIGRAAEQPELAYLFRHGLVQDAAYSTLLRQQRRAWHQAAGEVLESLLASADGPGADSLAPVLARHFSIAGDAARALDYLVRAADAAYERYALAEAGDHYAQALAASTQDTALTDPARLRHLAVRLGLTLELRSRFEDALRHYEAMEALAQRRGDRALELAVLMEQAKICATANMAYDPARSQALLERAAPLAESAGEGAAQARLLWTLMLQNLMRGGDPEERQAYGERALALAQALDLREQLAYIYQDLWFAYGGRLHWDKTRATLAEARRLWTELDHPAGLCEAIGRQSIVALAMGDYDHSLALADEAYAVASRIQSPDMQALSHAFVGLIHADHGDYDRALELSVRAVDTGAATGNVTVAAGTQADLAFAYGELGHAARGLPRAQSAYAFAREHFPLLLGWAGAVVARLHLRHGDIDKAAATLSEIAPYDVYRRQTGFMFQMWTHVSLAEAELALAQGQAARAAALMAEVAAAMQAIGMRFRLPEVLYLRGRGLLAQGRLAQARSELQAARLEAIALDARRVHWRILAALAEVETRSRQPAAAETWRRQARPLLAYIAEHTPDDLRATFLAQPEVQAILHSENV